MERFESLQELERVERAHYPAEVAEPVGPARRDVARFAELFAKFDPVIKGVRLGELGEAVRGGPVELSAVDDQPTDTRAMATDKLCCTVNVDVDPMLERPKDRRVSTVLSQMTGMPAA